MPRPSEERGAGDRGSGRPRHSLSSKETADAAGSSSSPIRAAAGAEREEPNAARSLEAGSLFGGYRLLRLRGRGGFAEVWESERLADGRRLALKILTEVRGISERARERFEREGRLAASLSHPRTVYIFASELIDGRPAIAMELVEGGSLQDRLDARGALPVPEAVDSILDVIDGLDAAQQLGIVHRDIKPSNCFVDGTGRVKIGDFGISKSLELDSGLTETGAFLGTPVFASPEQIRGVRVDWRSDLYSVGATLYALLTGRPPFEGKSSGQLLASILTEAPIPFEKRCIALPRKLRTIVGRLLSKAPEQRYGSYQALRAELLPFSSSSFVVPNLAVRFGAYIIDQILGGTFVAAVLVMARAISVREWLAPENMTMVGLAWYYLTTIAYFSILEWSWQTTPGKALFRMRVVGPGNRRIVLWQALARSALFWLPQFLLVCSAVLTHRLDVMSLLEILGILVPVMSMRRANAYAGIHELLTGTRVVSPPRGAKSSADRSEVAEQTSAELEGAEGSGFRGPYRVIRPIWQAGGASLSLAADDALRRQVWIHEGGLAALESSPRRRGADRPSRLRWLQGGSLESGRWDAFEAPAGEGVPDWIRARGQLGWSGTRELLLQLMIEVRASLAEQDLPSAISLHHLWIDDFGRLRMLEFPGPDRGGGGEGPPSVQAGDWPLLLQQFVVFALTGGHLNLDANDPRVEIRRVPLPESAQRFLERVLGHVQDETHLDELVAELRDLCSRPASVTRSLRLGQMACASTFQIFFAVGYLFVAFFGDHSLTGRAGGITFYYVARSLWFVALPFGAFYAAPALLLAFVFRGGPILRLFGLTVQDRYGNAATRARCLLRATVALAPVLLAAVPHCIIVFSNVWNRAVGQPIWTMGRASEILFPNSPKEIVLLIVACVGSALNLVFIAGSIWAVVRPDRSLQDRIAGTRLMPK